jgi:geranylgeranyl pyrophosphate synthase
LIVINPASVIETLKDEESHVDGVRRRFVDHPMLVGLLDVEQRRSAGELLEKFLFEPIRDLRDRPSKEIRGQLVRLGGRIATERDGAQARKNLDIAEEVVELLHAGSLIVDDIEDGSAIRRGQPSIHRSYGVPIALNAANWLYFWPLHRIGSMDVRAEQELELYRRYHRTLLRAHFGQAIDVGLDMTLVDQSEVREICLLSMELKTGALTAFALGMGAVLTGVLRETLAEIDAFGHGFGVALQMFDDLGNLKGASAPKQFEDLQLRRPSWVWAMAAQQSLRDYRGFLQAVRKLPDCSHLELWLKKSDFHLRARKQAHEHVVRICRNLEESVVLRGRQVEGFMELQRLGLSVERAYG